MKKGPVTPRLPRKSLPKSLPASDPPPSSAVERSSPAGALELAEAQAKREALISEALGAATGVGPNTPVAERLLAQFDSLTGNTDIKISMFMLAELRPANMLETMLVTQMVGVHEAALGFLRTSMHRALNEEIRDQNALRAARLMRLFNEQLEQLQRLKGTNRQQRVTVEHVHVNAGGQAIVGVVGHSEVKKKTDEPQ